MITLIAFFLSLLFIVAFFEQSGLDYMKAEAETILLNHLLSTTNITWHSSKRSPGAITWNLVRFHLPGKYLVPQYLDTVSKNLVSLKMNKINYI